MKKYDVCIIGLGYIGLPTAAVLANNNQHVLGVDINEEIVNLINNEKIHIIEPGLEEIVSKSVAQGRFTASTKPDFADVFIICVPTPFYKTKSIPRPDLTYIYQALKSIAEYLQPNNLIILESTSPVGTTDQISKYLKELCVDSDLIHIAYCPERVLPGNVIYELVNNDRVVGAVTSEATEKAANFYEKFIKGSVYRTTAKIAEMCKLTENSFRDLNIAFANELSMICKKEGINVWELIELANLHPRVNILQPGPGVGGHCIAVDPWFIVSRDIKNSRLIKMARDVNNSKVFWVINEIEKEILSLNSIFGREIKIAFLGITFKPDIDDLRESPSAEIVKQIIKKYNNVVVVEPNISKHENFNIVSIDSAIETADLMVILVKHKIFLEKEIQFRMSQKKLIDFCGAFQKK